jgi:hypothetical protein
MYGRQTASGDVNADLWRDNRRKYKVSAALLSMSLLVGFILPKLPHSGILSKIIFAICMSCYVAGIFSLLWARSENVFLNKPDRPEPPQLWKFRG